MADKAHDTTGDTDPDPFNTPGLEPGGGVAPGDTPPMADSGMQTVERREDTPNMGPISPNRTPMIIGLAFIALIVLAVLGYGVAEIITYATK